MTGAGGTPGGTGRFFLGLIMLMAGVYLFLSSIQVSNSFSLGYGLFSLGGLRVPPGLVLIPFLLGVGLIFYNARNVWGWVCTAASVVMLIFGVLASLQFHLRPLSALELLMMLVLMGGGLGLFLSALRNYSK
ncbi:MAG: hypothetical protein ICV83_05360 [Cytophagales bacterium]|nr:hypothetical protein [Cytophagales bacterium]